MAGQDVQNESVPGAIKLNSKFRTISAFCRKSLCVAPPLAGGVGEGGRSPQRVGPSSVKSNVIFLNIIFT
jgi:hypothetical protein